MPSGTGMEIFGKKFPDRMFDVGIAEQHAVTFAAGMACDGIKPIVAIYSTFLQRAYDQLIHDVAIQNLNVLFAIDRASLLEDGPTHSGVFDYSFLRCIPNLIIMAPSDENELRQMLYTGFQHEGPAAVRYPRGSGIGIQPQPDMTQLPIGKSRTIRTGHEVAILAFGTMLESAQEAAIELDATLVDMRFVKPLDHAVIDALVQSHQLLVTVEENVIAGGAGSAVNDYVAAAGLNTNLLNLGIPDEFIQPANPKKMFIFAQLIVSLSES